MQTVKIAILTQSARKGKKWKIQYDGKKIHFGAEGYLDYTQHGDRETKELYILRHQATGREQWNNPNTAGFWSRWLLWQEPTLSESIAYIEKKFKIKVFPRINKELLS